jgi:hypothetical protein
LMASLKESAELVQGKDSFEQLGITDPAEVAVATKLCRELRLKLARLYHDVRQEGAARALISEGNSHFRWGGMPTTVCRSQL